MSHELIGKAPLPPARIADPPADYLQKMFQYDAIDQPRSEEGFLPKVPETQRLGHRNEWHITYEGYDPEDIKGEAAWRRRLTLSNGIITVVPRIDGSTPITKKRGLFEIRPEDNDQSAVPGGLNIPDFGYFGIRVGESSELEKDLSTAVRTFDMRYHILTTSYDATDASGNAAYVTVTEFASLADPHLFVRKIDFTPNYSGDVSLTMGVNGNVDNAGHDYYESHQAEGLPGDFGVLYAAKTKYKGHEIAMAQKAGVFDGSRRVRIDPENVRINKGEMSIYHEMSMPVEAGRMYSVVDVTSVHSTVDPKRMAGKGEHPTVESVRDITKIKDFDTLLAEHKTAWENRWAQAEIVVDGDLAIQRGLRFNQGHIMTEVREGYPYAGIGAKKGNEWKGYGDRHFWDGDIYVTRGLTPEQTRTLMEYRYNLLDAARGKAERYFAKALEKQDLAWPFEEKGAFWPWEAHTPTPREENGEGGPEWVRNELGRRVPIESIEEEIHISADVVLAATEYYRATGDEEFMRTKGAEIILEAARFYASRAIYNAKDDRYEYHGVTGPDEYHFTVDNNAYTNYLAKWTILEALRLVADGQADSAVLERIGATQTEMTEWKRRAKKIYIPFDPETGIIEQFSGYHDLEYIDLTLPEYKDKKAMDVVLRAERTPKNKPDEQLSLNERNPVRATKVVKQHDVLLLLDLLGTDALELLSKDDLAKVRSSGRNDNEIMADIYKVNYEYYAPSTSDGSSLSPNEGIRVALNAGLDPDSLYPKYRASLFMDLDTNTRETEMGLHMAAMGGSVWAAKGFAGIRAGKDVMIVDPKLPSHWDSMHVTTQYHGRKVRVDIDNTKRKMWIRVAEDGSHGRVPLEVHGKRFELPEGTFGEFPVEIQKNGQETILFENTAPSTSAA